LKVNSDDDDVTNDGKIYGVKYTLQGSIVLVSNMKMLDTTRTRLAATDGATATVHIYIRVSQLVYHHIPSVHCGVKLTILSQTSKKLIAN